jgi:hypothetical protein
MRMSDLFPQKGLKAEDLIDGEGNLLRVTLTIKHVEYKPFKNSRTNQEELKPVLTFYEQVNGHDKDLIVGKQVGMAIVKLTGTDECDDWVGVAVTFVPVSYNSPEGMKWMVGVYERPVGRGQAPQRPAPNASPVQRQVQAQPQGQGFQMPTRQAQPQRPEPPPNFPPGAGVPFSTAEDAGIYE